MLKVEVSALVTYTCYLDDDDEDKVQEYAKENECNLEEAIFSLYTDGELDLYKNSTESDFSTESVNCAYKD